MFVSFTDWEFDGNVENAVEAAKGFWPEMKKYGAVNMRATVTGENTIRTMTLWSCLLYTSPSPRDKRQSRMPSSA